MTLGGKELPVRLAVLRQRVLAERGAQKERAGETLEAIHYWNDAVVDCGSRMHRMAVRASLEGLQRQASVLLTSNATRAAEAGDCGTEVVPP